MNEYEILGGLHKIIDDDTNLKMKEWLDSHNVLRLKRGMKR